MPSKGWPGSRPPGCATGRDDGSVTPGVAMTIIGLMVVLGVVVALGTVQITRDRVAAAADLGAIAAATVLPEGERIACDRAREVASRMRVSLTECQVNGWDVRISVAERLHGPLIDGRQVVGRARAGPTSATGDPAR
ncbi:hypothetical protein D5S17_13255 [Pseudonocardiaceae bacterium YIM PH 21723]|nr:hypothetical protein D5S17_13255 [Pseudonocardiaceae bacterium YIM PH 21723]